MKRLVIAVAFVIAIAVLVSTRSDDAEACIEPYETWYVEQEPEPLDVVPYQTSYTPTVRIQQEAVVVESEPEVVYYETELPEEIQSIVMDTCDEYRISPSLVIALIEKESLCDPNAIGDNGESLGLMQIYEYGHKDRMERLGVNDLLDPEQNIRVGVDILNELFQVKEDVYWVLMAYNGGRGYANNHYSQGVVSEYAQWVVNRAAELEDAYEMDR